MLSLLPTVIAMSPPDKKLASLAVAGCMATVAGGFGSIVLFVVVLAGVPCPIRLHFCGTASSNSSVVSCSRVDYRRVIGFVSGCDTPLQLRFLPIGGVMVVDVMFGLWLCVLCQICQIHCFVEEWFCQLAMWQKILPFGKLLFLASFMLYKGINKCMGRLHLLWLPFSKNWWKLKYLFYVSYSVEPNIQG